MFSLTWPAFMQIYWNKRGRLHKKRVQLSEDWFGTPTWPPFHCFGTQIWPPWRHVKTLYYYYYYYYYVKFSTGIFPGEKYPVKSHPEIIVIIIIIIIIAFQKSEFTWIEDPAARGTKARDVAYGEDTPPVGISRTAIWARVTGDWSNHGYTILLTSLTLCIYCGLSVADLGGGFWGSRPPYPTGRLFETEILTSTGSYITLFYSWFFWWNTRSILPLN